MKDCSGVSELLAANAIPQSRIAEVLGMTEGAVSRKMNGSREWKLRDIERLREWLRRDYSIELTLDDVLTR